MRRVAICLFLSFLAGACGGGRAAKQSAASASPGASSTPGSSASPGNTNGASSNKATAAPGLPRAAPLSGPIATTGTPPKTGTYTFNVTLDAKRSTRDVVVTSEGGSAAATKQGEKTSSDSASSTQHVIWRKDGKYLADIATKQGSNNYDCNFEPDLVEYKFPLKVGAKWSGTSSCTLTIGAVKVKSTIHETATVTGKGEVTIGGRRVKVWIINQVLDSSSEYGTRKYSGQSKRATQYAPEVGLAVRYSENSTSGDRSSNATYELQSTQPK